ncbi:pyridoxine 5'-phosphate synthase [Saccharicrinis sp. FJH62]|uniref:pyridoxine 5'-phosphate synthase n=1 Tax=Saccharicrinis sp. FJH62 TaxID=3344657 RepID=UPI0035D4225A
MTKLSVNINKIATLRNARGGNVPDVVQVARDCQRFGAHGITIHPRPDERHIKRTDVVNLRPVVTTEFNIEGYPSQEFIDLVKKVRPEQVTLVPDPPDAITSNSGWDTFENFGFLTEVIEEFRTAGIRTSIFIDTDVDNIKNAAETGTDRIELYTEPYASTYIKDKDEAVLPFVEAAKMARKVGLGINAGHDLSLENLGFLLEKIPYIEEVSIGHALICEALYYGLEHTITQYLEILKK